jgi:GNAT superfamily N-acetyltransferase
MAVREATSADAAALAVLLSDALGEGMYSTERIVQDVTFDGAHVLVADRDGTLAGGSVSRLLTAIDAGYYRRFGPGIEAVFQRQPIGSFEAVAVLPDARRQGIGNRLLENSLAWFRDESCVAAVAVSWISVRSGSSAGIFQRAGFTGGRVIADFYLQDSLREGWACPVCGGPCHCAAQSFHMAL